MERTYTEQDIQDYAAGTFAGDIQLLEEYIREHPSVQNLVQEYKLLYAAIAQESDVFLPVNMAERVIAAIEDREVAKDIFWPRFATITAILLFISAFIFCYRYFEIDISAVAVERGLLILSVLACIGFVIAFHFVEIRFREKKFIEAVS
ncbi:MAG: hypothetical protein WCF67_19815 [Chitinophagaceae bacterium]